MYSRTVKVLAQSTAKIHFSTTRQVAYGESHKIVGGHPSLGSWDVGSAPTMKWSDGDVWTLVVDYPAGQKLEFKCIKVAGGNVEWEGGGNHLLDVPNGSTANVRVAFAWGQENSLDVHVDSAEQGEASGHAHEATHQQPAPAPQVKAEGMQQAWQEGERLPHQQWVGEKTSFMRSNEHSRERRGVWDTQGLQAAALTLVEGDRDNGSWLGKLETAKRVLVDKAEKLLPDLDALANTYIYLQMINTGAIPCVEGGGHFRPNKHAELSRHMFKALERVIEHAEQDATAAVLARKLHARLPSFTEAFTQSTPLTRIRDIAHRNDIPHDLKQEIKHTIQNKLHRNAGPEDLVATEAMLQRVSADGSFSPDFVQEFRTFTAELRDFFNAGSFRDMLTGLQGSLDDSAQQVIAQFLAAKAKADSAGSDATPEAANSLIEALHSLTSVRAVLAGGLSSGLRNDASDGSIAMRQRWRLSEIRAEEVAFVLLSRFLNLLEQQGGDEALTRGGDKAYAQPLGAAILAVRHLGLGGWHAQECLAIENELGAWQASGQLSDRWHALRLKASLERLQRLTQSFTDALLAAFPARASALGKALGIQEERIQVFTEAEVRASVVFQASKLTQLLLKAARSCLGGAEWDAMVSGRAVGTLREVERIEPGVLQGEAAQGPVVLLVKAASGDEEVGAAGIDLRGVLLCHTVPHLSHLGVRARQEQVVFAMCDDEETVSQNVRPLLGKQVVLTAGADGVTIQEAAGEDAGAAASNGSAPGNAAQAAAPKAASSKAEKVGQVTVVQLEEAAVETCGSKSTACRKLLQLAQQSGGSFQAPTGIAFPFGCMDAALKEAKKVKKFQGLVKEAEAAQPGAGLEEACEQLQALIAELKLPKAALQQSGLKFEPGSLVIARSSANVEDLQGMSGAGLYDSLPNIDPHNATALGKAVASVWASLYTRRAVLTRRAAGVPQAEAAMAVLVQQQISPDVAFILHTASPLDNARDELYAELAVGLGETLASGTRGSPWRLSVDKSSGKTEVQCFANFSQALLPGAAAHGSYSKRTVDYSKQALSLDADRQQAIGHALEKVGKQLEEFFEGAQDVEGVLQGENIYIVQTRPQP